MSTCHRQIVAVAFLALAAIGSARPAVAQSAEADVRATEDRRIKALIDDDFATLEAIFADDLTYTHSSSVLDTKAAYMAALRSGKSKYEAIERKPSTVRVYGDTAIMTGEAQIKLRGQPAPFWLRYTLMYVKQAGAWKMVAWQSTRIPEAK
jgi:ketosteroid isomerase-like protein